MQNTELDSEYIFAIVTVCIILSFLFNDVCHFLTNILCRPSNEDEEYRRMRDRYEEEWKWKFRELKPYQVMITMNDPQCNPQQGLKWCNLAQNSQTFPTWPFIFQNIAFAASFWQPTPNLLSKQILLLNRFNETSSCSEIRPWSKLASTLKNKAGQIVCQILSSNMKEQKPKKHSLSSSLPLSSHVSTSFYLFPLPFILDMMCQMIYSVSNIDIWCVIDWSNLSKTSSFVLLSARLWLGCCCPNLRWARFGRRLMAGAFSSFLPVQNDLLWFSREIYIPTPVTFSTFTILSF